MGVPSRAVVVVYVDNGLVWHLSQGEYSTDIYPSAAVDPVAVKAVQVPVQWKRDRTLRLELDYNTGGTPFKRVTVLHDMGLGKSMVSLVWHVRNICQHYSYETVSGPKFKLNIAISFDRAGCDVSNAQFFKLHSLKVTMPSAEDDI